MARLRFNVGPQRRGSRTPASRAAAARDVRLQMDQVVKNAQLAIDAIEDCSPRALRFALRPIYNTSQELVPVDTGKLKASGEIDVRQLRGKTVGEVSYGKGNSPPYALIVHENLEFYHAPPTQAKFLEEAVNRHVSDVDDRYALFIKNNLGFGVGR